MGKIVREQEFHRGKSSVTWSVSCLGEERGKKECADVPAAFSAFGAIVKKGEKKRGEKVGLLWR